jgi:hypothetical protein
MPTGMMAPLEFKLSASTRSLMAAARNSVVLQRVDVPELEEEVGSVAFEQRGGDDVPAFLDMPLVASGSEDESADEDESTDAGEAEEAKLALSSSGVTLGATPLKEINPDLLKDLACRRGPKTPGKVLSLTS